MENNSAGPSDRSSPAPVSKEANDAGVMQIDSRRLLGSSGKMIIHHQGQLYQLRQTKSGKLILTK
ncbi:hemin uptake protein HemP [Enterobacillus tribolii]|uniref:Hemin uptake protein HemP n=1 Tax=Enterobacillus tribolii TaxID=1487935 RepID=A0A370R3N6_9GAMM|nr:hemin uptake protein HemP [Enterobacillus tribolii]MBW7984102.1 hemin uptake protein HemP [Enterobacillus tribolii]RDK97042.1 hemin uptake protein HemP [Enterobacillus tribolii]